METNGLRENGKIGKSDLLASGLFALTLVAIWLVPAEAWAQLATERIEEKFSDLKEIATKVAWGILGIGVIVIGVKMSNGDPDTKQRVVLPT